MTLKGILAHWQKSKEQRPNKYLYHSKGRKGYRILPLQKGKCSIAWR